MNVLNLAKRSALAAALAAPLFVSGAISATPNTSSYTLGLSGNNISVNVNNSEAIDSAEAKFAYSGDVNDFTVSASIGNVFTICAVETANDVACSIPGTSSAAPGSHNVATLTVTPNAGVTAGALTVSMTSGSSVLADSDGSETLNKSTLPSVTYTYAAPAPQSGSGNGNTGNTKNPTSGKTTNTTPANTASNKGATTGSSSNTGSTSSASSAVKGSTTTKSNNKTATAPKVKTSHTGLIASWVLGLLLAVIAVGYIFTARKAKPAEATASNVKATAAKNISAAKTKNAASKKSAKKS
jgi:hypothetical protein